MQQVNDDSLMEHICGCKILRPRKERILVNEYRLWMRVTCISELVTPDGSSIPIDRLFGERESRNKP